MKKVINFNLNEKCGIYCLINLNNGKRYIGSSKNLYDRLHQHFHNLKYNKHHSLHLQSSYNKYGEDCFDFEILEICKFEDLVIREEYWIDFYECINSDKGYNKRIDAERNSGLPCKEETKNKISNTLKEKYSSGEIITYKQEHAWIKCYVYDVENNFKLYEFKNLADADRFIYNKSPNDKAYGTESRLFNKFLNERYVVTNEIKEDVLNFCNEIIFKLKKNTKGNYLVSEKNKTITYYKSVTECAKKLGVSRNFIHKHIKNSNDIIELKSGDKIYYLAQYKSI